MGDGDQTASSSARTRVWCDGCYDMVHFGHANQLRQAKAMGDYLVVGVHTNEEIKVHKGPPVFSEQERYRMVRGIKWVDEVVEGAPYITTVETLDRYNCKFCVHGDDLSIGADGQDTYQGVRRVCRYRECKRTVGVSTTDLVGRMLLLTKQHHSANSSLSNEHLDSSSAMATDGLASRPWTGVSQFLASTSTITLFAEGKQRLSGDKVVYVSGSFDLFHVGHLAFLEEAAKYGDYLIVGIHDDRTVNLYKDENHPIQTLHERVLTVLAYRPVSEVLIGAPYTLTREIIDQFKIDVVAQGREKAVDPVSGSDPYEIARQMDILIKVNSGCVMTTDKIIERILQNRLAYQTRNKKKEAKEKAISEAVQQGVKQLCENGQKRN